MGHILRVILVHRYDVDIINPILEEDPVNHQEMFKYHSPINQLNKVKSQ